MKRSNELFQVITVKEALEKLKPHMLPFYEHWEEVPLEKAWGRLLANDIIVHSPLPHYRKSIVDGIALRAADTFGASESLPALIIGKGEILMGQEPLHSLEKGQGMLIPTGGMLPAEADSVVMVEYLEDFGDSLYGVAKPVAPGENIIDIGEDIAQGERILQRFETIRAQEMGLLAALGVINVPVIKRFRIGILSTGDEIVSPGISPALAKTRDINGYSLMGQAIAAGCEAKYYGIVGDEKKELEIRLHNMLSENDIIILSGGSSVGNRDLTARLIEEAGDTGLLFHGLALKPGKPAIAGVAQGKLIFGLPGHPASAMIVFDAIVRPWLEASMELDIHLPMPEGILTQNVYSGSGREEFVLVHVVQKENSWLLEPIRGKSGLISTMTQADGLIHISLDDEGLPAGKQVKVRLLR